MSQLGPPLPPFIGYCPQCRNPIYGHYAITPVGPAHPECARVMGGPVAKKPNEARTWIIVGIAAVGVVGIFVVIVAMSLVVQDRKIKADYAAKERAAAQAEREAEEAPEPERVAYLRCVTTAAHKCDLSANGAVKIYATPDDFNQRFGAACEHTNPNCRPSTPMLTLPRDTRVKVGGCGQGRCKVRIDGGKDSGRTGWAASDDVHDEPASR